MAATIVAFPGKLFNASHPAPLPTSLSAREAAFSHPRLGLHPSGYYSDRPSESLSTPLPAVALPAQVDLAVAHVDREIAHYNARLRLLHLMTQKYGSANRVL